MNIEKTFTTLATGKLSKTPLHICTLYDGDVEIHFMPNSHRYKIVKVGDLPQEALDKLNTDKSSGTSAPAMIDKSQVLINWAVKLYTSTVEEQMGDGANFTKDDVKNMLSFGEQAHSVKKKSAGDIGTVTHRFAEIFADKAIENGGYQFDIDYLMPIYQQLKVEFANEFPTWESEIYPKALSAIDGFIDWVKEYKPVFKSTETLCYSIKNNHLGLYDVEFELLAENLEGKDIPAGLYLGDNKTSNGIYDEHEYQLSSYFKAREEEEEYIGNKDFGYVGGAIMAFYKEDKLNKEGEVVHKAGEFVFKLLTRSELVTNYKVYKATQVIEQDKKRRLAEWRANNK